MSEVARSCRGPSVCQTFSPNPDTALLDCDGFSGPSIAPTPLGFEIVFPATGFNTKTPHDVDLYSSTVDLPVM